LRSPTPEPVTTNDELARSLQLRPTLKLQTDKGVYQLGNPAVVIVEISNSQASDDELAYNSWRDYRQEEESDGKEEESERKKRNNHIKLIDV
jgi:hypothetical protein